MQVAERLAAEVGQDQHHHPRAVAQRAQQQVRPGEQLAQGFAEGRQQLVLVVRADAQQGGLLEQFLQQRAAGNLQLQFLLARFESGALLRQHVYLGAIGHQQQHPLQAAGAQRIAGTGGELHHVAERAGLAEQLGAMLPPLGQGFRRGRRRGRRFGTPAAGLPGPDQGHRRMPQRRSGVQARALRGEHVHLLLDFGQRLAQVQAGQALPAQHVRPVPALVRGDGQAIGEESAVGRLGQPAGEIGLGIELLLLEQGRLMVAGDTQGSNQQATVAGEQAIALDDPLR
ncbi:Uncharacterised protein [Pseudomonas aeruginosa]|nr:Uncharacterised protein [Pseudomonas aeruginosa]